jgi:hypothetical protein
MIGRRRRARRAYHLSSMSSSGGSGSLAVEPRVWGKAEFAAISNTGLNVCTVQTFLGI